MQTSLLAPPLERLIADAIEEVYLQPERARISDLMRVIDAPCAERGWSKPAFRTIKRRLDRLDPRTVAHRRLGSRAARHLFDPVRESTLTPTMPLEVMQIDHTPVDVVIVDERQRLPIGRPWLTLAIDVASRVVLGLSVSLDAPSVVSVALALTHAVLPKDIWLADRELEVPWPMVGVPDALHLDNAPEFHSAALARGAQEYGMRLTFRPPAQPHFGGNIERLIGTMMGAVHLLPGTTFSNVVEKGDYRPEDRAALTLTELERWLTLEIAGVYHHAVHTALGMSPLAAWRDGLARRSEPPRQPRDRQTFFLDFLPGERRLVRRDGIQLFRLHYWDNVLSPWAGRSREPMLIKYNPRDLSQIFLRDDQGTYWPIPYRRLGQPAISLWEQRAAVARLHAAGHRAIDDALIFKSVLDQRTLVEVAQTLTTRERRARARARRRTTGGPIATRLAMAVAHASRTIAICRPFRWRNGMSEDLAHLEAAHRVQAGLSADERIEWIRQERWIHYPRADQVIDRLADLLTYPPRDRMPCLLLFGATGMGKTRIVHKFLREHRSSFDERCGRTRLPVAAVQLPPTPNERDFYEELLISMGAVLPLQQSVSTLRHRTRILARQLEVRMLIIDEIHAILAGTYREQRILLNSLRFLANDLHIPLVCAGTHEAKAALMTDQQLADRFEAWELPAWQDDAALHQLLTAFASILPLRQASEVRDGRLRRRVLGLTEGIMVRICRLMEAAAIQAIETGHERIDLGLLTEDLTAQSLVSMSDRRRPQPTP